MATAAPELSVVIAAHNEAENIAPMCRTLAGLLAQYGPYEIIFVEDASTDGTLDEIRAAARDPSVRYVSFTRNFGHQAALRAGLRHSRGRAVIVMDADFEHPPELIPELVAHWRNGAKVITALRLDDAVTTPFAKRTASALYYRILNALGDIQIEPGSADYLLLDRVVVDAINELVDHELFLRGIVRWFGYQRTTVAYRRGTRVQGSTKYSLKRRVELAVTGIAAHSIRPLRFAIWMALGFAVLGVALVCYSILSYFLVEGTVHGWTSVMAAIAILGAAQLLVLGIIGEYVGRVLRETRRRPSYVIRETEADRRGQDAAVARLNRPAE
jgi:dolichol-phosphate mannosyltransferase